MKNWLTAYTNLSSYEVTRFQHQRLLIGVQRDYTNILLLVNAMNQSLANLNCFSTNLAASSKLSSVTLLYSLFYKGNRKWQMR